MMHTAHSTSATPGQTLPYRPPATAQAMPVDFKGTSSALPPIMHLRPQGASWGKLSPVGLHAQALGYLETPLRWNTPIQQGVDQGALPVVRQTPLQWMAGFALGQKIAIVAAILIVLAALSYGVWEGIRAVRHRVDPFALAVNEQPGMGLTDADDGLGNAFLAVSKANQTVTQKGRERQDPFRPLVKTDWLERIWEMRANEAQQEAEAANEPLINQSGFGVMPPPASANSPGMPPTAVRPFPAAGNAGGTPMLPNESAGSLTSPALQDALRYVGIIRDKHHPDKRTILLQYRGSDGTRLINKPLGSRFTLEGQTVLLRQATSQYLDILINGSPTRLNGFKGSSNSSTHPASSSTRPQTASRTGTGYSTGTSAAGQAASASAGDDDIEHILKELDGL
jgi:hypothetical protein